MSKPFEFLGLYRRKPIAWDNCSPFFEDSEPVYPGPEAESKRERVQWWSQVRRDNRIYNVIAWGKDDDYTDYLWRPGGLYCDRSSVSHTVREHWDEQTLFDLHGLMESIVDAVLDGLTARSIDGALFDAIPYKWLEGYWFMPLQMLTSPIQDATVNITPPSEAFGSHHGDAVTRLAQFRELMQSIGFADHVASRS